MVKIIYSNEAINNLIAIEAYYKNERGLRTARKVTNAIMDDIDRLAVYPKSGGETPSVRLNRQGYRKLISAHYVIIYKYDEYEETVYVDYIYREVQNMI